MPAATRRARYSSIFSGATSKATWFMEPMALVRSPWSGRARRRADPRHTVGRIGEPEEGEAVAAAAVEEEVLSHPGRQLDRLDQRHAENVGVEVDRPLHVAAHQGEMVDAPQLESVPRAACLACHAHASLGADACFEPGPGRHRHRIGRNPVEPLGRITRGTTNDEGMDRHGFSEVRRQGRTRGRRRRTRRRP